MARVRYGGFADCTQKAQSMEQSTSTAFSLYSARLARDAFQASIIILWIQMSGGASAVERCRKYKNVVDRRCHTADWHSRSQISKRTRQSSSDRSTNLHKMTRTEKLAVLTNGVRKLRNNCQ